MNYSENMNIELNHLSIQQLRNLQWMVNKKLKEKTAGDEHKENAILTNEELDMLALITKS